MRDGHNGYGPSPGIPAAREAVAAEYTRRGFPVVAGPRVHHRRHVRRHRARAERARRRGRRSARADADLPALHGGARQARRARAFYRPDRRRGWMPDLDHLRASSRRRRARSSSSIPTIRPARRIRRRVGARCSTSPTRTAWRSSPTRCTAISASTARSRRSAARSRRADHLVLEPVEGVSRARLAHGLDGRRPLAAPGRRGGGGEEAGGRPAVQHGADAVRDRGGADRRPVASGRRSARR